MKVDKDSIKSLEFKIVEALKIIGSFHGKKVKFIEKDLSMSESMVPKNEWVRLKESIYSSEKKVKIHNNTSDFLEEVGLLVHRNVGNYVKYVRLNGSKEQTKKLKTIRDSLIQTSQSLNEIKVNLSHNDKKKVEEIVKKIEKIKKELEQKIDKQFYDKDLFFTFSYDAKKNPVFTCRRHNQQGPVIATLNRKGFDISQDSNRQELSKIFENIFSHNITINHVINSGNNEILKLALASKKNDLNALHSGHTPLNVAVRSRNLKTIKILLKHGADINGKDSMGNTPLCEAAKGGDIEIIHFLLESGANLNLLNNFSDGPLSLATDNSHTDVVKMLLEHGADVNVKNTRGDASLLLAAQGNNAEIVKMLLEHGADVNVKNSRGWTPLFLAAERGNEEIFGLLMERGADVQIVSHDGLTPSMITENQFIRGKLEKPEGDLTKLILEDLTQAFRFGVEVMGEYNGQQFPLKGFPNDRTDYLANSLGRSFLHFIQNFSTSFKDPEWMISAVLGASDLTEKELFNQYFYGEKPIMFLSGWPGHSICHVFVGDYYIQANRGDREDEDDPGFYIYKINKPLTRKIFRSMTEEKEMSFFTEDLHRLLDLKYVYHLQQAEQMHGNCTYASFKSGVYSLILLSLLKQENLLDALGEHPSEDIMENFINFLGEAHKIYKAWVKQDRENVKTLIDSYNQRDLNAVIQPNLSLVLFILARYKGNLNTFDKMINFLKSKDVDWNGKDIHGTSFIEKILQEENYFLITLLEEEGILSQIDLSSLIQEDLNTVYENMKKPPASYKPAKKRIKSY